MALMYKSANDCKFTRNSFQWFSHLNKYAHLGTHDQINVVRQLLLKHHKAAAAEAWRATNAIGELE